MKKFNVKEAIESLVVFKNLKYNPCLHALAEIFENNENKNWSLVVAVNSLYDGNGYIPNQFEANHLLYLYEPL